MSLHVDRYVSPSGSASLLLIHGWGMHGGMWRIVAEKLAQDFDVYAVDLPGHGYSKAGKGQEPVSSFSLDAIVDELSTQFDQPLSICGWSLGGQMALRWALRYPQQVERLVMVASTPCFAEREDWSLGMAQDTLQSFASELEQNHSATLRRFLALQLRGSANERELLLQLREQLFNRGEPDKAALRGCLEILRDADLRESLPRIKQPTLLITGERDKLTPPQASQYMAQMLPAARVVEIESAAHVPFLSHPEEFVELVLGFMHDGRRPPLVRGGREGFWLE
jgi:pimeloyl-[acyl-carrier protein] methyl ester esterase